MGWGNCGTDSRGRPIGYVFEATCDHPGCKAEIHRGLAYACGGMHGEDERGCEKYFCEEHLTYFVDGDEDDKKAEVWQCCFECEKILSEAKKEEVT